MRIKLSISPISSSELYVYRCAAYNPEKLDDKQVDNIIKIVGGKETANIFKKKH